MQQTACIIAGEILTLCFICVNPLREEPKNMKDITGAAWEPEKRTGYKPIVVSDYAIVEKGEEKFVKIDGKEVRLPAINQMEMSDAGVSDEFQFALKKLPTEFKNPDGLQFLMDYNLLDWATHSKG